MKTIEMPTATDEQLVEMLRAVANPVRYRILQILAERGECQCGPLGDLLPIAPSTLSQHLKVLREAGLISGTVDGPTICYCREEQGIAWLKDHIASL
ncbi:MAG TPA: metalloregulator ArsR/SmtB family transcription factor [Thermomicrobiales bacterium]|nr:metalloregulator ArsR/SmtB family transcription factor [Thermomicrobiales bacterium]HEX5165691.1 metalloregulator ArsR/SmtB family transcription factor [Thermomicrobiales bacterium]